MTNINVNKNILSFADAVSIANSCSQSALMIRHSYRESLANGNYDPGLTAEGMAYAVECGKFLKGMKDVCFGSSPRKRTVQTIQGLMQGAEFEEQEIPHHSVLHDTAMFSKPENLGIFIEDGTLGTLLKEYYTTGSAQGFKPAQEYVNSLLELLTAEHAKKNLIVSSHDIVAVALLNHFQVYSFVPEDWCGYIQGVFLYRENGSWNIAYIVPDKENRPQTTFFV